MFLVLPEYSGIKCYIGSPRTERDEHIRITGQSPEAAGKIVVQGIVGGSLVVHPRYIVQQADLVIEGWVITITRPEHLLPVKSEESVPAVEGKQRMVSVTVIMSGPAKVIYSDSIR